MDDLFRITFLSTISGDPYAFDIDELAVQCQRNNRAYGVTGILLWSDGSFFQVLEGRESTIKTLMETIEADTRHHSVVTIEKQPTNCLLFPEWPLEVCTLQKMGNVPRSPSDKIDRVMQRIPNGQSEMALRVFASHLIEARGTG